MTTPIEAYADATIVSIRAGSVLEDKAECCRVSLKSCTGRVIKIEPCWANGFARLDVSTGADPLRLTPGDARDLAYALLELVGDGKEPSDEAEA